MKRVSELRKLITGRISDRGLRVLEQTRPTMFVCIGIMIERKMTDEEVIVVLDEAMHLAHLETIVASLKPSKVYPVIKNLFRILTETA